MHMLVYVLVEASTRDDALARAEAVFDQLTGATWGGGDGPFDYYRTCDDDDARWSDLPAAARVESDPGQDLLDRAWEETEAEFQQTLDAVRDGLAEYSAEEIMRDEDLIRYQCYKLGAYRGPTVPLYDQNATGIRHRGQLDDLLTDADDCWIVPADVHY